MTLIGNARFGFDGYGNLPNHPYRAIPNHILWFFQIDLDGDGQFDSHVLPPSLRAVEFERGVSRRDDPRGFGPSQPEGEHFRVELVDRGGVYWNAAEARSLANMVSGRKARILCVSTTFKTPARPVFTGLLRSAEFDPRLEVIIFKGSGLSAALTIGGAAEIRDSSIAFNAPDLGAFIPDSGAPAPIHHWRGQLPGTGLEACVNTILEACGSNIPILAQDEPVEEQPEYFTLTGGSAWNAIKAVCSAYLARVEFSREGTISLRRLARPTRDETGAISLDNCSIDPSPLEIPTPGVINRVRCRVRPLRAPLYTLPIPITEYGTAWSATGPIVVPPGMSVVIDARFKKTEGSVFAANILRVNTDLTIEETPLIVNSLPDKSGVNMAAAFGTGEASFEVTPEVIDDSNLPYPLFRNFGGWQDQCRITLRNTSATRTAYFFNLRLYGAGLSQSAQPSWVEVMDEESVALFGERAAKATSPLIQSEGIARQTAMRALSYFKAPTRAVVTQASQISRGDASYALFQNVELNTLVHLPASATHAGGTYRVIGESARWLNGAGEHSRHEWRLEKALAPQVTVGSQSSVLIQSQGAVNWTHNGGTKSNEYFMVCASTRSWGWISAITVDGAPLERLAEISLGYATNGDQPRVEMWGGVLPAGVGAVSVTLDKPDWGEFASLSVADVNLAQPVGAVLTDKSFDGDPVAAMELGESDLMLCVAGFQQYDPPSLVAGEEIYALTTDNNWRGSAASAIGLREAKVGWADVTGGYALAGVVLNARWHHNEI